MRVQRVATVVVVALNVAAGVHTSAPVVAQTTDQLKVLEKQIGREFQKGNYDSATELAELNAALVKAEHGDTHPKYASALSWLAAIAQDRGEYEKAEAHYKRVLEIDEAALGPDHADVGRDCSNLGLLYSFLARFDEAEALFDRAIAITEKALGPDDIKVATRIHNKAALLRQLGRYNEAEPLLKRALGITEKSQGPKHGDVGKTLSILGRLYLDMERYEQSEVHHRRALAIFEKAFGPTSVRAAYSLHDLADLYQTVGQNAEAERLIERALDIRLDALGEGHAVVARSRYLMGGILERQGRVDDALQEYQNALAIQEKALGQEHPDVGATLASLGVLRKSQSRFEEARELLERGLAIQEKALGPNHPRIASSLLSLSEVLRRLGRQDDADKLFERARTIRKSGLTNVPVLFATNRRPKPKAKSVEFGTHGQADLTFGVANLSILKDDSVALQTAQAATPQEAKSEDVTDVARLSIPRLDIRPEEKLIESAQQRLSASQAFENQVLVFLHGYNVDFDNAVRRAGQIAYDLNFDGPTFLFSWPSRQSYFGYLTDRETIDIATEQFKDFLARVVVPLKASKVHLVAHSMGNLILLRALSDLSARDASRRPILGEVIDAAPDVAPGVFRQFAGKIQAAGGNLTVYASAADKALWLSNWLWDRPRVGYIPDDGPELISGVDLIDITRAGMALFATNHDVYASNPVVVADMRKILGGERPPEKRTKQFHPVDSQQGKYWVFRTLPKVSP